MSSEIKPQEQSKWTSMCGGTCASCPEYKKLPDGSYMFQERNESGEILWRAQMTVDQLTRFFENEMPL